DPNSQEALTQQKLERVAELARAAPHDPLGEEVVKHVNHMKIGNPGADPLILNNTLEAVASLEHTHGVSGQVRGDPGVDLKRVEKKLDAQLEGLGLRGLHNILGDMAFVPEGTGASDLRASLITGEAGERSREFMQERADRQQAMNHDLPPLSHK